MNCPICNGSNFGPFNGRPLAHCLTCGSLERSRISWMTMKRLGGLTPGLRVLHLAPERGLADQLFAQYGSHYHATDVDTARYRNGAYPVFELDCCTDLKKLPTDCFDVIIHNHVLEHVPCAIEGVLVEFARILKPTGWHFFTVPFSGANTRECLEPMAPEHRKRNFGQEDHIRIFGTEDFTKLLSSYGFINANTLSLFTEDEFAAASVPMQHTDTVGADAVFIWHSGELKPVSAISAHAGLDLGKLQVPSSVLEQRAGADGYSRNSQRVRASRL
jgi:hypothetical protein